MSWAGSLPVTLLEWTLVDPGLEAQHGHQTDKAELTWEAESSNITVVQMVNRENAVRHRCQIGHSASRVVLLSQL